MKPDKRQEEKEGLKAFSHALFHELKTNEHLTLSYSGEDSFFLRVNQAKVTQTFEVSQRFITMDYVLGHRHTEFTFPLTGNHEYDINQGLGFLQRGRNECQILPEDPYVVLPEAGESSEEDHYGKLLEPEKVGDVLLKPAQSVDIAGIFASGLLLRGYANSQGQFHWFSTENFYFDYSLYTPSQKAVKATYAGNEWQEASYLSTLEQAKDQLKLMEKTPRKLAPGKYRVYLAPAAVAEIVRGISWSGVSGKALMQGTSPFIKLSTGDASLSPLLWLEENFGLGVGPRFNEFGDISPSKVPLIVNGKLNSLLINRRTAQEFGLQSNAANAQERLRSPLIHAGTLKGENILKSLDTGLYISNLHYLNWSDLPHGRLTGMTRYGCFWVENGELISPIEDMRFDETLYHFWGNGLEDLSEQVEMIPDVFSYGERILGGVSAPGMLVNDFTFTL